MNLFVLLASICYACASDQILRIELAGSLYCKDATSAHVTIVQRPIDRIAAGWHNFAHCDRLTRRYPHADHNLTIALVLDYAACVNGCATNIVNNRNCGNDMLPNQNLILATIDLIRQKQLLCVESVRSTLFLRMLGADYQLVRDILIQEKWIDVDEFIYNAAVAVIANLHRQALLHPVAIVAHALLDEQRTLATDVALILSTWRTSLPRSVVHIIVSGVWNTSDWQPFVLHGVPPIDRLVSIFRRVYPGQHRSRNPIKYEQFCIERWLYYARLVDQMGWTVESGDLVLALDADVAVLSDDFMAAVAERHLLSSADCTILIDGAAVVWAPRSLTEFARDVVALYQLNDGQALIRALQFCANHETGSVEEVTDMRLIRCWCKNKFGALKGRRCLLTQSPVNYSILPSVAGIDMQRRGSGWAVDNKPVALMHFGGDSKRAIRKTLNELLR